MLAEFTNSAVSLNIKGHTEAKITLMLIQITNSAKGTDSDNES